MRVLAGDIGGGTARLALCEVDGTAVRRDIQAVYPSPKYDGLEDIAREFMTTHSVDVPVAAFGVPGPVRGRRGHATNLPWEIDADQLERNLGIKAVHLLNNIEATARGLTTLAPADYIDLRVAGGITVGNQGLVAAGTGLGEAGLYWDGRRHRPFACEGGHADFAARNEREDELLAWLRTRHQHVSWERVLSARGLVNVYEFLKSRDPSRESEEVAEAIAAGEASEAIIRAATRDDDELASETLDWWMELYGAETGNVALKYLATGGMFLGGSISAKIATALGQSGFTERFDGKGRMRSLLETISIRIITNDHAALQGAAYHAARRARGERD